MGYCTILSVHHLLCCFILNSVTVYTFNSNFENKHVNETFSFVVWNWKIPYGKGEEAATAATYLDDDDDDVN